MAVNLSALAGAGQQFFDNSGNPLSGGKLWSYAAGTTTPQTTYTTAAGNVAHANPIILDAAGRVATGEIWLTAGSNYKFVLMTSTDVTLVTWDNITGINGTGIASNAENVAYDPPFTGAVPTNVEAKLAQSVNAKDFGFAVNNTGAQNATALISALNAANVVELPSGTYTIDPFNIPENKSLVGQGSTNTILQTSTSGNAITFDGTYNTQLHGFTLNQTGPVQGKGLYLIDQYFVTMIDVTTNGFEYGLYAIQSLYHYIRECKFEGGAYGAYYGGAGAIWNVDWFNNVLTFENCRFNGNSTIGTYVKGCEVIFANCDWSGMVSTGAIGLKVEGSGVGFPAHGIQIIQPYAELTDIIFSFSFARVEINGGFVQGGTAAGAAAATSIIDVTNSSAVFWRGSPRDSDYWDFGYRVTNSSNLNFDTGFTQSVRASNTVDGTSVIVFRPNALTSGASNYLVTETTPGTTAAAVASYNTVGLKRTFTSTSVSVPTATPTTTTVLKDRTSAGNGDVYLITGNGYDASAVQEVSGLAFVTIYNDGITKRAAINSISTQRFTWSSISTDGTITFQHSATNSIDITFNAIKMD